MAVATVFRDHLLDACRNRAFHYRGGVRLPAVTLVSGIGAGSAALHHSVRPGKLAFSARTSDFSVASALSHDWPRTLSEDLETARSGLGRAQKLIGILLQAPRPAGEARATSIPRVVCKERATKPAGQLVPALAAYENPAQLGEASIGGLPADLLGRRALLVCSASRFLSAQSSLSRKRRQGCSRPGGPGAAPPRSCHRAGVRAAGGRRFSSTQSSYLDPSLTLNAKRRLSG